MAMAVVVGDGIIIDICCCFAAALENEDLAMELAAVGNERGNGLGSIEEAVVLD